MVGEAVDPVGVPRRREPRRAAPSTSSPSRSRRRSRPPAIASSTTTARAAPTAAPRSPPGRCSVRASVTSTPSRAARPLACAPTASPGSVPGRPGESRQTFTGGPYPRWLPVGARSPAAGVRRPARLLPLLRARGARGRRRAGASSTSASAGAPTTLLAGARGVRPGRRLRLAPGDHPAGAFADLDAVTVGYLTEPLPAARRRRSAPRPRAAPGATCATPTPRNFDRIVSFDPLVAPAADPHRAASGAPSRSRSPTRSSPPVRARRRSARRSSSPAGRPTHRDAFLDPVKHDFDVVHLAHGVTDEHLIAVPARGRRRREPPQRALPDLREPRQRATSRPGCS